MGALSPWGKCGHFFACFEAPNKNSNGATNLFGVGIRIFVAMQEIKERCSAEYHKIVAVRDVPWTFFMVEEQSKTTMSRKILLMAVNAKYIHTNPAIYSLWAYAEERGYPVEMREFTINQQEDRILSEIYRTSPDVLAVSVYIWNIGMLERLLPSVRAVLPETEIWLGGPEVSFETEEFLRTHPYISGIIRGEGEETFSCMCGIWQQTEEAGENGISDKKCFSYASLPGISWRNAEDRIHVNPDRPLLSMDDLVFPYEKMPLPEKRIIYYESSRGCPFSCAYCLSSVEKQLRFRSLDKVKAELQYFLDRNVPQVKFVDRTFNCQHTHAMEIWRYLKEHDNGITNFHFEIGADILTEEEIALISTLRKGQIQLEIGVQTTNEETLCAIHRRMDFAILAKNVRALQQAGNVHLHLDLIAGLPHEDLESFRRSFNMVYALQPEQLQLGFLKVLKGSPIYQKTEEYACDYKQEAPYEVLQTGWLDYGQLLELKNVEEMVEVYYNSGQFVRTIAQMETMFDSPYAFYQALASWYEGRGYLDISHSRLRRFEILREFSADRGWGKEALDACLIMDLYSRENLKNRPVWAPWDKRHDDSIRHFYQKEAAEPAFLKNYAGYDWKQLRSMTHIELVDGESWLFDYRDRDPLSGNAGVRKINL